jgi:uncharacterized RDD family membrane protein YckC
MEHRLGTGEQEAVAPMVYEEEWKDLPDSSSSASFSSSSTTETLQETQYRAGFWLRLVAFMIDTAILGTFSLLLIILGAVLTALGGELSGFDCEIEGAPSLFPLWLSGALTASAAYFTILHGEYGQTIGKNLLGLEVRTPEGEPLGYSQALFRWLGYGVSASFFGLGFLWVALNPGKRGWHDLLANTVVVARKENKQ